MVPADAVIGLPGDETALEYDLSDYVREANAAVRCFELSAPSETFFFFSFCAVLIGQAARVLHPCRTRNTRGLCGSGGATAMLLSVDRFVLRSRRVFIDRRAVLLVWLIDCRRVMEYDGTSQALPIGRSVHFFMDGFRGLERYCIQRASEAHNRLLLLLVALKQQQKTKPSTKQQTTNNKQKNRGRGGGGLRHQLV